MMRPPLGQFAPRHVSDLVTSNSNAPCGRHIQAAQEVQQRCLSRAARPHEGYELALVYIQVEALEDVDLLTAPTILLVQAAHLNQAG